jgi:hypothetical protein
VIRLLVKLKVTIQALEPLNDEDVLEFGVRHRTDRENQRGLYKEPDLQAANS